MKNARGQHQNIDLPLAVLGAMPIHHGREVSLRYIGEVCGVSPESIALIYRKGLKKLGFRLKAELREEFGEDFLRAFGL